MKKVRIASLTPAAISQRNNTKEEEARRTVTEERKTTRQEERGATHEESKVCPLAPEVQCWCKDVGRPAVIDNRR